MDTVHEEEYKNHTIKIYPDYDTEDPRKWMDQFGHMICWHSRYNLGDKHKYSDPSQFRRSLAMEVDSTVEERIDYWENGNGWHKIANLENACDICDKHYDKIIQDALDKHAIILPLYLYDHSGITMRCHPFSCPWDSGQVGYIYATYEQIREEYSCKRVTKGIRERATNLLVSEVKEYDQFLTGDVYGFVVEDSEETEIDSCWGFYGMDYCIQEAKSSVLQNRG